ncbi:MAG: hypothetical protein LBE20_07750 [Deltaproteobacteria bacterium]|jgi:hypothetical protein|nr:hypothetical protein [Deltaproteobacteria bacterium]
MRKLLKVIKAILIIIVVLVGLVYGIVFVCHKFLFKEQTATTPTIAPAQNNEFIFGIQGHSQPQTMDEYIALLAEQVKNYQRVAPTLWFNNALISRTLIVEALDSGKFWRITPNGEVSSLSRQEVLDRGIKRVVYAGGFSEFDGGMYLVVSDEYLHNVLLYQQYLHLGTYDPFITFVHEDFHGAEQGKWAKMKDIANTARNEFLENIPARAKRDLLQRQLLQAIATPGNKALILEALATYEDYKVQFPDDFKNSFFGDRIEGTAYYYELIASLYSAYPDKIKTKDDLNRALALLATRDDIYVTHGLVVEGYSVGGFACILLDRFEEDWQSRLMADAELTPIEMLRAHFATETIPAPRQLTSAELNAVGEVISASSEVIDGRARLFTMLYQLLF